MENLLALIGLIILFIIIVFYCEFIIRREARMNKVHFYVTCENVLYKNNYVHVLWMGKPIKKCSNLYTGSSESRGIAFDDSFYKFGLNIDDFADMKVGEIREVFIKLK